VTVREYIGYAGYIEVKANACIKQLAVILLSALQALHA
jgi:hypothetical protein